MSGSGNEEGCASGNSAQMSCEFDGASAVGDCWGGVNPAGSCGDGLGDS